MRDQERAPRQYELMTILHPEVPEESLPAELDRITGYIDGAGGSVIETLQDSPWGRRRLAYPIRSGGRDVRDGYYSVWHMNLSPHRITDLERELKLNTQIIRYIVVSWAPIVLTEKEIEAAEIAAEDAAAAAFTTAQTASYRAEDDAAAAYAAEQASAQAAVAAAAAAEAAAIEAAAVEATAATASEPETDTGAGTSAIEPVAAEEARDEVLQAAAAAAETTVELAAQGIRATALTAEAEAVEATGAELAIEAVAEVEEREELAADAAAALELTAAAVAAESPAEPESETQTETEDAQGVVPAGAVRGDGATECPDDYPIKGNASSMLYHSPGSPSYKRTMPEFCFASVDAAEAAGFKPTKYEAAQEEGE